MLDDDENRGKPLCCSQKNMSVTCKVFAQDRQGTKDFNQLANELRVSDLQKGRLRGPGVLDGSIEDFIGTNG